MEEERKLESRESTEYQDTEFTIEEGDNADDTQVTLIASPHPIGEKDDYDGLKFRQNELEEQAATIIDQPMLYEHNNKTLIKEPIGVWKKGWVTEGGKGRLVLKGKIDGTTPYGAKAITEIREGKMKGVSLGVDHLYDRQKNKIVFKRIKECSVTSDPALPAPILYISPKSKDRETKEILFDALGKIKKNQILSKRKLEYYTKRMEEAATAAQQQQQQVAPQGVAKDQTAVPASNNNSTTATGQYTADDFKRVLAPVLAEMEAANKLSQDAEKKRLEYEGKSEVERPAKRQQTTGAVQEDTPTYREPIKYEAMKLLQDMKKNGFNQEQMEKYYQDEIAKNLVYVKKNMPFVKEFFLNNLQRAGIEPQYMPRFLDQLEKDPMQGAKILDELTAICTVANNNKDSILKQEAFYQNVIKDNASLNDKLKEKEAELKKKEEEVNIFRALISDAKKGLPLQSVASASAPPQNGQQSAQPNPQPTQKQGLSSVDFGKEFRNLGFREPTDEDKKFYAETGMAPPSVSLSSSKLRSDDSREWLLAAFSRIGKLEADGISYEPSTGALDGFFNRTPTNE